MGTAYLFVVWVMSHFLSGTKEVGVWERPMFDSGLAYMNDVPIYLLRCPGLGSGRMSQGV